MIDNQSVKFGDVCKEVKLTTKDPIGDGYERYIGLEHLDSGSLKIKRWGIIAEDSPSFTRVFKKGHVLIGKRRAYLRKAAIADFDGICSSDIIVVDATNKLFCHDLLPFIVQSEKFWQHAIDTSSGSLSPRTKFASLKTLPIKLGSNESQAELSQNLAKFSSVINSLDGLIECSIKSRKLILTNAMKGLNKNQETYLDRQVGILNENYKIVTLDKLLSKNKNSMRSGPFGSALKKDDLSLSGTPFLGIDNVFEECFSDDFKRFVPDDLLSKFTKFEVFGGDVMITIMGTVGRACVYPYDSGPALSSKHLWTMTFENYPSELMAWQLNYAPWVKHHFSKYSQGGIMDAISSKVLKTCPIIVPLDSDISSLLKTVKSSLLVNEELLSRKETVSKLLDSYLVERM